MDSASEIDCLGLDVQRTGLDPALLQPSVIQPIGPVSTPEKLLSPILSPTSQPSGYPFMSFVIPSSMTAVLDQGQRCVVDTVQQAMGIRDTLSKICDQLFETKSWWILESIPPLTIYQEPTGDWTRKRTCNFGRGRYITVHNNVVKVHNSVKRRIEETKGTSDGYTPQAYK